MLVTEEEAQDIECQDRTRNALLHAQLMGEQPTGDYSHGCIASKCMFWRLDEPAVHDAETGEEKHPALGHCGLAGKP